SSNQSHSAQTAADHRRRSSRRGHRRTYHRASGRVAGGRRLGVRIIPGLQERPSLSRALQPDAQASRAPTLQDAGVDARVLAGHALHLDRARLISQRDRVLEAREGNAISGLAARRLKREPVSRILGTKEFWSLALAVTPDVLVPRPETETVVEGALDFVVRGG